MQLTSAFGEADLRSTCNGSYATGLDLVVSDVHSIDALAAVTEITALLAERAGGLIVYPISKSVYKCTSELFDGIALTFSKSGGELRYEFH